MSRSTLIRLLESFFRRWWLYLVPVVLLGGLGLSSVFTMTDSYRSVGTMNVVSSTLLGELTQVGDNQNIGYDLPNEAASKQLNSWLQTDQFVTLVVAKAGLDAAVASGEITLDEIRRSVGAFAGGPNLLRVAATTFDPVLAQRLAHGTMDAFVETIVASQVNESAAAQAFLTPILQSDKEAVDAATAALATYVETHPSPVTGTRRDDEQLALNQLSADLTEAQDRYNATLSKIQDAQLQAETTKADVVQRLRIIDPAEVPLAPLPKMKEAAFGLATFLILGGLLAVGAVIVTTILDRTIRTPEDVKQRLKARLLAVVPDARRSGRKRWRSRTARPAVPAAVAGRRPTHEPDRRDIALSRPQAGTPSGVVAPSLVPGVVAGNSAPASDPAPALGPNPSSTVARPNKTGGRRRSMTITPPGGRAAHSRQHHTLSAADDGEHRRVAAPTHDVREVG